MNANPLSSTPVQHLPFTNLPTRVPGRFTSESAGHGQNRLRQRVAENSKFNNVDL